METTTMKIGYGNSTTGYAQATLLVGSRGGLTVTSHNGDPGRVTRKALIQAARQIRNDQLPPTLWTTAGDAIDCWEVK